MATHGPFKWTSHTNAIRTTEWEYACSINGFVPVLGTIQNMLAIGKLNSTPSTFSNNVTGIGTYNDQSNGNFYIVVFTGTKGYTGVYSSSITFTDRTGAVTISSATNSSDTLNAIFVAVGGGNVPIKLTTGAGNFAVLGGSPPSCNIVKTVNNFMFLANAPGATATKSRLYWSNVSDPETWGAGNFVDVRKNDGYGITALGTIGNDLYIFKPTSISRFGTTTFTVSGGVSTLGPLETVNYYLGANNSYNVCPMTDGRIAFLASDSNFYIYDGNSFFNASSQPYPNADLRTAFGGASTIIGDGFVYENPYEKCLYVFPIGTAVGFGYDYVNNFWFNTVNYAASATSNILVYSLSNTFGAVSPTPRLLMGTADSIYYSNTGTAVDNDITATMKIRLPYERLKSLPRSIVFDLVGATGSYIRARAGFNTLPSAYALDTSSVNTGRYVIPINYGRPSTTGSPGEFTVVVELGCKAGNSTAYGNVYLSDSIQ